ncbi:helix-turn-helix domain-containing protein [Aquimonas voraii]|uniref:Cro/C1-type HTH DNA-binding domain-containing protein n=1 Tax=Aquimonas voraii TaxID=265719 RepID=A0A1G6WI81_9GAMM|nr:Cro/C1-type HTH DNA-binding domain-containing protein [Aquimonas voraii]
MALRSELVDALKRLLKAQGLTYAALAARLGISEPTVKRMLSKRTLTLERLEQICGVLQIGLSELAEEAQRGAPALAELSVAQEQALVEDPALLLALYLVLNRWSQGEVLARYRFSEPQWTLLLARLDRLGIIELQPGNRARTRTARNFRWRREGPMQRFFQQQLLPDYFGRGFEAEHERLLLLSGMVSRASALQLMQRLEDFAAEFDRLMAQDAGLPAAQRVGLSLVLAQRPWSLSLFSELRRAAA